MKYLRKLFHRKYHHFKSKDDFEHFWETMKFVAEMEAEAYMKEVRGEIES
jgi:hypothetical protein